MKSNFIFAALFSATFIAAQTNFIRKDSIPVFVNSQQLNFPWTGGINYGQFSPIDLNQDGIMDLFVFDRDCFFALPKLVERGASAQYRQDIDPEPPDILSIAAEMAGMSLVKIIHPEFRKINRLCVQYF